MRSTLALAATAGAFASLDTALNIAFPDLADGLGIEVADLQWVVVSYVLSSGGALLAAGQLGDAFDHRRMLAVGALISAGALSACALAPSFAWFLAGRVAQGLGAAMVMAAGPALAVRSSGPDGRARALGVFQGAVGAGAALGPALGGVLVGLTGWPGVFWFRVPPALALAVLGLRVGTGHGQQDSKRAEVAGPEPTGADVGGAVILTAGLAGGLLAIAGGRALGIRSPLLWLAVGGTVAAAGLYRRRAATRRPDDLVIDPAVLGRPSVAAAAGLAVVANGTMFVTWLLVPTLVVDHMGYPTAVGGLALAASPVAMGVVAPFAGRWTDRVGPRRPVIAGLIVEATGLAWLVMASPETGIVTVAAAMAVLGSGLGLFGVANMAEIMAALPPNRQGTGGALALLLRTTGIVVGVAGAAALFDTLEAGRGFAGAYRWTTGTAAALAGLAALATLVAVATAGPRRWP